MIRAYLNRPEESDEGLASELVRAAVSSVAETCIIPLQDYRSKSCARCMAECEAQEIERAAGEAAVRNQSCGEKAVLGGCRDGIWETVFLGTAGQPYRVYI